MPYTFKKSNEPGFMEIHEEEYFRKLDRELLESEIASLKANRNAYTDESLYRNTLAMLEGALRFLLEEQS